MSEEWKQPPPLWARATPLALVIAGIIVAFAYTERERAKEEFDQELEFADNDDGAPQVVYVRTSHVTADHWERIASLTSLRGVNLSGTATVDEGIERLTSLPNLQSLTMNGGVFVDDALIRRLAGISTLKRLLVRDCRGVTDESVDALIGWKSLQGLDLAGTSITWPGLIRLREARRDLLIVAGAYGLQIGNLNDLSGAPMYRVHLNSQADVDTVRKMLDVPHNWRTGRWHGDPRRQFENVELSGDAAGAALPALAAVLEHVRSLTISETRVAGDVGNWSDALKSLYVWGLAGGSDLSGFARCPSLTSIQLDKNRYGFQQEDERDVAKSDLEWLAELPHLRELCLTRINLAPEDVEQISRIDSLESLQFYSSSCETIDPLLVPDRLPNLRELCLYGWEIDPDKQAQLRAAHPATNIQGHGFHITVAGTNE